VLGYLAVGVADQEQDLDHSSVYLHVAGELEEFFSNKEMTAESKKQSHL
jgi:hypothetical protein